MIALLLLVDFIIFIIVAPWGSGKEEDLSHHGLS